MYLAYFGLSEAPFSIAPDPRYLYMTRNHQEALAHLLYGVEGDGGFVLLTGEVGAGKTTVSRCLLEQIPDSCDVAYIFNPRLTAEELLSTMCVELDIALPPGNASIKVFIDAINTRLLDANARGRHTVLIIDEAQNLSTDVLEQMRLLTNLETNQRKLLQIILLGQPEFAAMLERPALRQLAQRIVARYHLGALNKAEIGAYVRHRLEVAGTQRPLFPEALMGRLYRLTKGVPRVINVICDRALLGAYVEGKERVDRATLARAAREVFGPRTPLWRGPLRAASAALLVIVGAALALGAYRWHRDSEIPTVPPIARNPVQPAGAADAPMLAAVPKESRAEQAPDDTLAWPAEVERTRSRAMANAVLFQAWGAPSDEGDACRHAKRVGLRCLTTRGGLDELRKINRPAVMHLSDAQGDYYATLTRLDERSATLSVGGDSRSVPLDILAAQWSGHYTVVWRLPPEARDGLKAGVRGPGVAWLNRQLARGREEGLAVDAVFDDALVRRVKQFQLAQGLIPDGIIGPQTLMHLTTLSDESAPKLAPAPGDKQ